jgi:chlorobactene glucosyltransferase
MIIYFLCFLTVTLFVICCVSIYNIFTFVKIERRLDTHIHLPFVSILIPARNEERCIRDCIESLCNQHYPHYEIIVLDDQSTDSTSVILDELKQSYPELLTIIHSSNLPENWIGKSYACHVLSLHAKGDYLLFVDADTVHSPYAVNSLIDKSQQLQADLLTAIPEQKLTSIWEHLIVPFMHILYHGYLPNSFIYSKKNPAFIAANGQIMLFHRDAYDAIDGHQSVKSSIVEDLDIARVTKKHGFTVVLANGIEIASCSMYSDFTGVFRGFSKNFFPGFQGKLAPFLFFLIHLMNVYVVPIIMLTVSLIFKNSFLVYWSLFLLFLGLIIRLLSTIQFRLPLFHVLLQPFTAVFAIIIGINSVLWSMPGKSRIWKERHYQQS